MRNEVSVVVATFNGMPYVEQCLESVAGCELVVVDSGSTDGTLELVRERFPQARLIDQEFRGLAAAWNSGIRAGSGRYVLLLNSDAWFKADGLDRLLAFADEHTEAGIVGPRLLNLDGTLQRSVRGFPTLWRLATEYLLLRKLAPRSRALNAFYGGHFEHDSVREAEFLRGACLLLRREAVEEIGLLDESLFLFSEEVDLCYRMRKAGWKVLFYPGAEVVHVGGATWKRDFDPMFREQVRGHLRFLAKHHGLRAAERARKLMLFALRLRALLFRGGRRRTYRDAATWLASAPAEQLIHAAR